MTDDFTIVIPTAGRAGQVKTLNWIPSSLIGRVRLAVRVHEVNDYLEHYPDIAVMPIPDEAVGPAAKRQKIMENCSTSYLIQIDDDFKFFRRVRNRTNLLQATEEDMERMFDKLMTAAKGYGHAGVSTRGGNNHVAEPFKICGRMAGVYAHDVKLLNELGLRWDRLPVMEDFDITLNLLRRGIPNYIIYDHAFDQAMTNQPGGCNGYRTPELQMDGAIGLETYHHPFVKAAPKKANNWQGFGGTRWDVTVYWQRALAAKDMT